MFGPIATEGMPSPNTYDSAFRLFHNTKPWRGCDPSIRPLRRRAEKSKTIVLHRSGDISLRLYSTDVVTWHSDNTLTCRTWDSASTAKFAWAVLPVHMSATLHHGEMFFQSQSSLGDVQWYRAGSEPLRFRPSNKDFMFWECVNPHTATRYLRRDIDRDMARQIRAKLRPFENWVKSVAAISNGDVSSMFDGSHTYRTGVHDLLHGNLEPEDWPTLLRRYCRNVWISSRDRAMTTILAGNWLDTLRADAYRHMQAFTLTEQPIGLLPVYTRWGVERRTA